MIELENVSMTYPGGNQALKIRLRQDQEEGYTEGQKKDWSRIPELQASEGQDYIRECCICTESYPDSGEIHQKTCSGHADAGWTCRQVQIISKGALRW